MQVIPPLIITDAILTNSTVPEVVSTAYAAGTTYAAGARVGAAAASYGVAQTIYESLQAGNVGHALSDAAWWKNVGIVYPVYASGSSCALGGIVSSIATDSHLFYESLVAANTGNPLTDETKWLPLGSTNRWAMFGLLRNTKTAQPGALTVVFAPGKRCNSLGLGGIVANYYALTVTSVAGGGTIYSASGSLNVRETLTWYDFFFREFLTKESLAFFDIPPYADAIFTLTLTATSGDAEIGACGVGNFVYLGSTQYSAVSDVINYSTIERDTFGDATLIPRRNIPKTNQTILCEKANVNNIRAVRTLLNATPAFWYGLDDGNDGYFESLFIVGIYKQFSINVNLPENAEITLELEEI